MNPSESSEHQLQNTIQMRDEFLSVVSHELKTPITTLKLQLQMARHNIRLKKPGADDGSVFLNVIESSLIQVNRLTSLIENFLDVTRVQIGEPRLHYELVDLPELLNDVIVRFNKDLMTDKIVVHVDAASQKTVECDPFRLKQVFSQLLSNAIKYGNGQPIHVDFLSNETIMNIAFKDGGIGIASDCFQKIFERFERAVSPDNFGGLGLGLYICKQIITAHQGRIVVESQLDHGSTFTVQLPLRQ